MVAASPPVSDSEDVVAWEGKADYNRERIIFGLVFSGMAIILLIFILTITGKPGGFILLIPGLFFLFGLMQISKYEGVRYRITKRKIVIEQSFLSRKRTRQIPIEALTEVKTRLGRNLQLGFRVTNGDGIILRLAKGDIEKVRSVLIAAGARPSGSK